MFFQSAEQRTRSAAFDTIITKTDEVLCQPAFLKALGEQAAQALLSMNQAAFLPNFKDGVVVVLDATDERTGDLWRMVCHVSQLRETWGMDAARVPTMNKAIALRDAGLLGEDI